MKHEKIVCRGDGSRLKISVELSCAAWEPQPVWRVECSRCERGKRTWVPAVDIHDPALRRLSTAEHNRYVRTANLRVATSREIESAMRELLDRIKVRYA